jgi:hypothetical protein
MESKFTKGDWHLHFTGPHWNNPDLRNIEICYNEEKECICDTVYEEADAHLIAAAPELYKNIQQDINILKEQKRKYVIGSFELRSLQLRIETKEKLLAKARGEHE